MRSDLRETQLGFTSWLRDPEKTKAPADIPLRRMQAYRELVTNNVASAIDSCFPVASELVGAHRWENLVGSFFTEYRCTSPIYRDIPAQFLKWLEASAPADLRADYPWLLELLHYEWMELALDIDPEEIPSSGIAIHGRPLEGVPILNPLARLLTYRFAVHRISNESRPERPEPNPVHLVMVRQRDHEIGFLEVNPLVARLVEVLRDNDTRTGSEVLDSLQAEYPSIPPAAFRDGGTAALTELMQREIILGTRI